MVEARAVMDGDQRVAQGTRRHARLEELGRAGDVPDRLGHLRAARLQVRAMQPGLDEGLAGGRFALRDLVLVVREDQVDAARVDLERWAEVSHAHRGALDVPTGTA